MPQHDFELSSYQKDIIKYFKNNPQDNIYVEALAGSAKTFTILELTEETETSDVYLAFNNSIVQECKQKIKNPKTKVYTTYSLAYAIMNANISNGGSNSWNSKKGGLGERRAVNSTTSANLDNLKIYKIVDEVLTNTYGRRLNFEKRVFLKDNYVQLYTSCRLTRTAFNEYNDKTKKNIEKLIDDHNLFEDFDDKGFHAPNTTEVITTLQEIDKISLQQFEKNKIIDFTDMLYITCLKLASKEWSVPYWFMFTNVYCDECMPGDTYILTNYGRLTLEDLEQLYNQTDYLTKNRPIRAMSFNERRHKFEEREIVSVTNKGLRDIYEIKIGEKYSKKQYTLKATENHIFYTTTKWQHVSDLIPKDADTKFSRLGVFCDSIGTITERGLNKNVHHISYKEVSTIEKLPEQEIVYDIEVEGNHNFLCTQDYNSNFFFMSHNCQDFNNLQLNFIRYIKRPKGRYVFVLDENQAIYAFNSANANSCRLIKKAFAPVKEFSLPVCYRCPETHLALVRNMFNIPIKARPGAPAGKIMTIEKEEIPEYVKSGDMIIARKNKWLASAIVDLAIHGIPICIEDKDLVDSVKKILKHTDCHLAVNLKTKLQKNIKTFKDTLKSNMELNGKLDNLTPEQQEERINNITSTNNKIDNINFILDILTPYIEEHPNDTKEKFETYINKLLNTTYTQDCVKLCSVHKAKGLEAENVFVLNEAKVVKDFRNSPEQQKQEENLSYISITRAKQNLYLVKED